MNKLASIELIQDIFPHSNADKLEIAVCCNYRCVVPKNVFKINQPVIFISPDSVLPDTEWATPFKKFCKNRIRAQKIRGEWSCGLILSPITAFSEDLSKLKDVFIPSNIGLDISNLISVSKYETPVGQQLDAKGPLPWGIFKTDEDNWQKVENLNDYLGLDFSAYLKIDGQSATYFCKKVGEEFKTGICSRQLELKPECDNKFTFINKKYQILDKLLNYCKENDCSLALRGELYGNGIQSFDINPHCKKEIDWALFSVLNLDNLQYYRLGDSRFFEEIGDKLNLPTAPKVESGVLTLDIINKYYLEKETINNTPFEGIVIQTKIGSFKVINFNYDSKK